LPEETKERFSEIQRSLGRSINGPGWVKPRNMHLTLKFLGNIDAERTALVSEVLERATALSGPFTVTAKKIEFWGRHILRVQFKENKELTYLKERIENGLEAIGVERDKRAYSPHLTLRRIKKRESFLELKKALETIDRAQEISFFAENAVFMESELTPGGAIHSLILKIKLHRTEDMDDI
jgi:2'-5' RNA ligase